MYVGRDTAFLSLVLCFYIIYLFVLSKVAGTNSVQSNSLLLFFFSFSAPNSLACMPQNRFKPLASTDSLLRNIKQIQCRETALFNDF